MPSSNFDWHADCLKLHCSVITERRHLDRELTFGDEVEVLDAQEVKLKAWSKVKKSQELMMRGVDSGVGSASFIIIIRVVVRMRWRWVWARVTRHMVRTNVW